MFTIVLILTIFAIVGVGTILAVPRLLVPLAIITLIDLGFAIILALTLTGAVPVSIH